MKVAFVGLGTMGGAMAGHIQAAGHALRVFNRSDPRADAWTAQHGGTRAATLREAVDGAEIAFLCLSDDRATADVLFGPDGLVEALPPGALIVDHGSGSPATAREFADKAGRRDIIFFDAPVTGGGPAARAGTLAVMAGAAPELVDRARPVMACYSATIMPMGPVGAGHLTKLVNVIIGQGTGLAVAEGLGFAISAGLDPRQVVEVLLQGSSRSWLLEHRSAAMIERDFTPRYPLGMARKDLGNVLQEARACGAPLPLTALVDQLVAALALQRGDGEDLASLIRLFTAERPA